MKQPTRDLGVEEKACLTDFGGAFGCIEGPMLRLVCSREYKCSLPTQKFDFFFSSSPPPLCNLLRLRIHHSHTHTFETGCGLLLEVVRLGTNKFVSSSAKTDYLVHYGHPAVFGCQRSFCQGAWMQRLGRTQGQHHMVISSGSPPRHSTESLAYSHT